MRKKRIGALLLTGLMSLSLLAGCGQTGGGSAGGTESKGTISIGYVNWAEGIAMTNLVQAILEDKLNYTVELTMTDASPLYASLASGGTDVFVDAWLPITQKENMDKYGDQLDDLGPNYENARIGLVVPSYMDINSIEELNDYKDTFGGNIVGIDAGAGIMTTTDTAIQEYGLDYDLMTGSGPTMTAALKKAVDAGDPVVVTGWTPHWMFARWDLKFLDDPKMVYGEAEHLDTLTRKGFSEDMPEVAEFLTNFFMTEADLGNLMGAIADSEDQDPLEVSRQWMNDHEELVNSWLPAQS